MGTQLMQQENGVSWEAGTQLIKAGLCHGVTCRAGGVSTGAYGSLNLALHVGDDPAAVMENRRRLAAAAGFDPEKLTTPQQTHEDHIIAVSARESGNGAVNYDDALPHTDALMTNCPGIPLMICTADCVPVVLYDPVHKACAVVHDGWRGTVAKLAAKTVSAMHIAYQAKPEDIVAFIGPSISQANFEVGKEAVDAFMAMGGEYRPCFSSIQGKTHIDLWEANKIMLVQAGVKKSHIDVTHYCTYDETDLFYSYRRDHGKTGRMGTFVVL